MLTEVGTYINIWLKNMYVMKFAAFPLNPL